MRLLARADARSIPLPDSSVHCCVTSPPYWGLRDYGTAQWSGGDPSCDHLRPALGGVKASTLNAKRDKDGYLDPSGKSQPNRQQYAYECGKCGAQRIDRQLGLEKTPDEYVAAMVSVFREVRRVLRDDGTLWLNLGDSYAGSWSGNSMRPEGGEQRAGGPGFQPLDERVPARSGVVPSGLKPKDLVGIPWRVAFALQADGWYLRSDIIWAKPNPMPESVTDRPTKAHEYVFLLTKSARYYYDAEAIREADVGSDHPRHVLHKPEPSGGVLPAHQGIRKAEGRNGSGRNRRTVWTVATQPYSGAHFATFPPKLIEPCILAGTSERGCCPECGAPWERVVEREPNLHPGSSHAHESDRTRGHAQPRADGKPAGTVMRERHQAGRGTETTGWRATCDHEAQPAPCTVLDPFVGSGTTVAVAVQNNRRGIGLDLGYHDLAKHRTNGVQRVFA